MSRAGTQFQSRRGENPQAYFNRSGRFYCKKGSWFFKTREAIEYGPYQSRVECRYAYQDFIDIVSSTNEFETETLDFPASESEWQLPKINFN